MPGHADNIYDATCLLLRHAAADAAAAAAIFIITLMPCRAAATPLRFAPRALP